MFIRKAKKRDPVTKKAYYSYQLVESYRSEKGPRQRILLNLGARLNLSDSDKKLLASRIEEVLVGVQSFFEYPEYIETLAQTYAKQLASKSSHPPQPKEEEKDYQSIDLNSIQHEQARSVGAEHIVIETLKTLDIPGKLKKLGMSQRKIEIVLALISGRLLGCNSERETYEWMQQRSAIDELLHTNFATLSLNSLYDAGDQLLRCKEALELHLANKEQTLFDLDNTIILYDLTNTYFEGKAENIARAKRGHSKEKRSDCPLVTLGLVLNKQGFPLQSRLLSGNVSEPGTLKEAIQKLSRPSFTSPTIVLDGGIATEENLQYLRENNYSYIVASRSRSCEVEEDLKMTTVRQTPNNTVTAAVVEKRENGESLLYCHSIQRQKKEEAIASSLQARFESDLRLIVEALSKRNGTKAYPKVVERIGRLKEKHRKIASHYHIEVIPDAKKEKAIEIRWSQKEDKIENRFQGGYNLRIFGLDWDEAELWNTYVMLTKVEAAFRSLKSELGLRPVYHQTGDRVDAHLFITVLAYHVMQTILYSLDQSDISLLWNTLRNKMSTLVRVSTLARLESGNSIYVRTCTNPTPFQRDVLKKLRMSQTIGRRTKARF